MNRMWNDHESGAAHIGQSAVKELVTKATEGLAQIDVFQKLVLEMKGKVESEDMGIWKQLEQERKAEDEKFVSDLLLGEYDAELKGQSDHNRIPIPSIQKRITSLKEAWKKQLGVRIRGRLQLLLQRRATKRENS